MLYISHAGLGIPITNAHYENRWKVEPTKCEINGRALDDNRRHAAAPSQVQYATEEIVTKSHSKSIEVELRCIPTWARNFANRTALMGEDLGLFLEVATLDHQASTLFIRSCFLHRVYPSLCMRVIQGAWKPRALSRSNKINANVTPWSCFYFLSPHSAWVHLLITMITE